MDDFEARLGNVVDRWRLESVLGTGGMAAVYEGVDDGGNRAAIKLMHARHATKGSVARRFTREAQIIGVSDHPRAIEIFGTGKTDAGEPYYAMEIIPGTTLMDRWREQGRLRPAEALAYADSLLGLLASYHEEGVVHRDIKPQNLIVDGADIRLVDFGVARYRDVDLRPEDYTREGTAIGTPAYMAPEQAMGKTERIDQRTDLFAVGAVLFAVLSGTKLHSGSNSDETLVMAATNPAESVARFAPHLPEEVVKLVDRAVSWYPADRFQTADEMRASIRALNIFGSSQADGAKRSPSSESQSRREVERASAVAADDELAEAPLEISHADLATALREMFRSIERALKGVRLYTWGHPDVDRRVADAHAKILEVLAECPEHCGWQVRLNAFVVDDEPIWQPGEAFERVPFHLFSSGFRHIRLLPKITVDDFGRFLRLITLNPEQDLPAEDDLATAFWDLDVKTVQTQMVTTFRVSDDDAEQRAFEKRVGELEDEVESFFDTDGAEQFKLLEALADVGEDAIAEARHNRPDTFITIRLAAGSFAPAYRDQFVDAIARDQWMFRAALVLVSALEDVELEGDIERLKPALSQLVPRFMLEGRVPELFELVDRMAKIVGAPDTRDAVFEWVFDRRNVQRIVLELTRDTEPWPEKTQKHASAYLGSLGSGPLPDVLESLDRISGEKRRVLLRYLLNNCRGRELLYAHTAVDAAEDTAIDILKVLTRASSPTTPRAMIKLLEHSSARVRETTLKQLSNKFPSAVDEILLSMAQDEEAQIRVQALRLASATGSETLREHLAERAHQPNFHELPFTERRLILETLFDLDRELAQETSIELIRRKLISFLLDPAVHTTRTIAIALLGEVGTTREAYEVLEDAARRRLGNPKTVRKAARLAIKNWQARL